MSLLENNNDKKICIMIKIYKTDWYIFPTLHNFIHNKSKVSKVVDFLLREKPPVAFLDVNVILYTRLTYQQKLILHLLGIKIISVDSATVLEKFKYIHPFNNGLIHTSKTSPHHCYIMPKEKIYLIIKGRARLTMVTGPR